MLAHQLRAIEIPARRYGRARLQDIDPYMYTLNSLRRAND